MDYDNKLVCFFAGLGIGVTVGILVAPKSGADMRDDIKGAALGGADYVRRRKDDLHSTVADAVDRGKQSVQRQKESLTSAVEAGKQAYNEAGMAK